VLIEEEEGGGEIFYQIVPSCMWVRFPD